MTRPPSPSPQVERIAAIVRTRTAQRDLIVLPPDTSSGDIVDAELFLGFNPSDCIVLDSPLQLPALKNLMYDACVVRFAPTKTAETLLLDQLHTLAAEAPNVRDRPRVYLLTSLHASSRLWTRAANHKSARPAKRPEAPLSPAL